MSLNYFIFYPKKDLINYNYFGRVVENTYLYNNERYNFDVYKNKENHLVLDGGMFKIVSMGVFYSELYNDFCFYDILLEKYIIRKELYNHVSFNKIFFDLYVIKDFIDI